MAEARLNEIIKIRKGRIDALREKNIDPYPAKLSLGKTTISKALDSESDKVTVAGRLMASREHGNNKFADLK